MLLTFLAYALTLVHSVVPHVHDKKQDHHHEHTSDHHHHDEGDNADSEDKNLTSFFAEVEHQAGAETFIRSNASELKVKQAAKVITASSALLFSFEIDSGPSKSPILTRNEFAPSSEHFKISLLRAPPAIV
jgi:hypothetical protein